MLALFRGDQFEVLLDAQDDQQLADQVKQQDEQGDREEQVEVGAKVSLVGAEIFGLDDKADALRQRAQQRQHRQGVGVGTELEQRQQPSAHRIGADDGADGRDHAQADHVGAQVQLRLDEGGQRQQLAADLDVAGGKREVERQRKENDHRRDADEQAGLDAAHVVQDGLLILGGGVVLNLLALLRKFFRNGNLGGSKAGGMWLLLCLLRALAAEQVGLFVLPGGLALLLRLLAILV